MECTFFEIWFKLPDKTLRYLDEEAVIIRCPFKLLKRLCIKVF